MIQISTSLRVFTNLDVIGRYKKKFWRSLFSKFSLRLAVSSHIKVLVLIFFEVYQPLFLSLNYNFIYQTKGSLTWSNKSFVRNILSYQFNLLFFVLIFLLYQSKCWKLVTKAELCYKPLKYWFCTIILTNRRIKLLYTLIKVSVNLLKQTKRNRRKNHEISNWLHG